MESDPIYLTHSRPTTDPPPRLANPLHHRRHDNKSEHDPHRDEHFQRGIAGAGTQTRRRSIDAARTVFDRDQRVGNAHRQIVVAVETDFGFRSLIGPRSPDDAENQVPAVS